jgi:dTDP-4-amino-4,6-dideoxygalactose transaminase
MTQLQSALLRNQIKRLEEQTKIRHMNGTFLNSLLEKIDGIKPLDRGVGETLHSYHIYIFKYDKSKFNNLPKHDFAQMLAAEGVPCFMGYPQPLYKQPLFQEKNFMCYAIPNEVDYSKFTARLRKKHAVMRRYGSFRTRCWNKTGYGTFRRSNPENTTIRKLIKY